MCTCRQTGKIPVHGQGRMFDYTFECTTAGGRKYTDKIRQSNDTMAKSLIEQRCEDENEG